MVIAREPQGISNEFLRPELSRLSKNFRENQRLKPDRGRAEIAVK
jgi:hypothetical protein